MKILAIETATEACSAALYVDGEIEERFRVEPRRHSELILPMMEQLLATGSLKLTELDALAFGQGPGSFTGVRIATGVIQGAAFGADLPVVPVSTLAALAQRGAREFDAKHLLPAFDARMNELYWGCYQVTSTGLVEAVQADRLVSPGGLQSPEGTGWVGVGTGWQTYGEILAANLAGSVQSFESDLLCSAWDVALLAAAGFAAGKAVSAEQALPVYLRDKVAWKR
ncbi:MAG: tRNA (adenosine(37)-N6)-threonylcarbamoyltransferase complex dimerization subunit type 1 TsaB [Gammaproteobacteria bacterium]|nr:tRNA (adenosine(37)-N6)-threonylcarbamoyltransferase complex dimerization subunit type 1 TsaB [Gammaproteobacteria bacterium]